jgi:hypothetical protein
MEREAGNEIQIRCAKPMYQVTEQEKGVLTEYVARLSTEIAPRIKVVKTDKGPMISPDHPDELVGRLLLKQALGTTNSHFSHGLIMQLANAGSQGSQIDERGTNFLLSIVEGIKPTDQLEAMLAAQMAAIHNATMTFARRLAHVETLQEQDSAERALNKLARTYVTQMEALKRYRAGGEQTVNVSVSEGGQAIVGNVTQPPRENAPDKPAAASPLALSDARTTPMPIMGKERAAVPARDKINEGKS